MGGAVPQNQIEWTGAPSCAQSGGNLAMTHDPMQSYAMQNYGALGGYPAVAGQFGVPYQGGGISPFGQGVGISPLQNVPYQNPLLQNPYIAGLQNPLLQQWQNPLQHLQQNPLLQHAIQAQIQAQLAQQLGLQPFAGHTQQISPFGQSGLPFGQLGQFGQAGVPWTQGISPLAPQTWIGQGGQFGGYGQMNPLAYLAARGQYTPAFTPWAGI
jgi:hypothetical protein